MQLSLDTLFTLGASALIAGLSFTTFSRTEVGDVTSGWGDGAYQRGFESRFEKALPTYETSASLWAATRWLLFNETANGAVASQDGWLFTAEEFTEPATEIDFDSELRRVAETLAAYQIGLVPIIIPDKARMYSDRLARPRSGGFQNRYDRALATIGEAGLLTIDLRPVLSREDSFMRTDTHWSPEGAKSVAKAIASSLISFQFDRVQVSTNKIGERPFEGDLLAFVATGPFRGILGPTPETISIYETVIESRLGLFDDASLPVALVGTSYSAKPDFHFEGFLKDALRTDLLNASAVGRGPFLPMEEFLNEISQLSTLPTSVIWEIPERYISIRNHEK